MDEFFIPSTAGNGGLLFYDRSPYDLTQPIGSFWVRVSDHNLSAAGHVYAGYGYSHPVELFAAMAARWTGWPDELTWNSPERELVLRCTHDRLGHIALRVELQWGPMDDDWRVEATVMTEAGQLEALANRAALFFGRDY